jgi:excisionase family DNA binding protein
MDEPIVAVTARTHQQLLTVQEFASLVRIHPLSVYRMIREGRQRGVIKLGRHIRINASIALLDMSPRASV